MTAREKEKIFLDTYSDLKRCHRQLMNLLACFQLEPVGKQSPKPADKYVIDVTIDLVRSAKELKSLYKGEKLRNKIIWAELSS
jgi:hypothetical protein